MSKISYNGQLTPDGYDLVISLLGKDLGCNNTEASVSNILSQRTGYDVYLDLSGFTKVSVSGDYTTEDRHINFDHIDTDTHDEDYICSFVYAEIDRCIDDVDSRACIDMAVMDDVLYYDDDYDHIGYSVDNDELYDDGYSGD